MRKISYLLVAGMAAGGTAEAQEAADTAESMRAVQPIMIDGRNGGRRFDGVGGVSAGASTRLLIDYPEPARSEILDYLFKPNYGASLQILKVEIGSDINATDGAEASHMRTRDDLDCDRGYEWWLMKEAVARNPDIVLAGLQWGAPGWFEGGFWSQDNVEYLMKWLDCARNRHGLEIDYMGGWNESGYEAPWFVLLDRALRQHHPEVGIIAADDLPQYDWRIATDMANDLDVNAAIDVLGQHSPGTWRSLYQKYSSTEDARRLGKPLWVSEQSALSHDVGGVAWARGINRAYIDAEITASMHWAPVTAWYPILPHADTGLLLAVWPWSGHYRIGSNLWVHAHTAQFARPGWQYIDSASGYLQTGASYVTLKSPDGRDFSIVVETLDATRPSQVQFTVAGGLTADRLHVWSTNLLTDDGADDFVQEQTLVPEHGVFTTTFQPGYIYSVTTTTGQFKGEARAPGSVSDRMPLPYQEDFEGYEHGELARYFSDINGGFETAPAGGGRRGTVYRQMVPAQPISWHLAGGVVDPTTIVGDPRWWGDYEVSADVLLEQEGYVELIGRIGAQAGRNYAGYHLRFGSDGTWQLYGEDLANVREEDVQIAAGRAPFSANRWHELALRMERDRISAVIDGVVVGSARDTLHTAGSVGLRVSGWDPAQFDNVRITPTSAGPRFVPQDEITATATSEHDVFYRGDVFKTEYLTDARPESFWHSALEPRAPLPQSLTLDLGQPREVHALTYQPRIDNQTAGMITRYNVYLSDDGRTFTRVAEGGWPVTTATKVARWPGRRARYVRLEAVEAVNGTASAAEVNVSTTPIP